MEYSVPMKRSIILLVLLALAGTATLGAQTTTPSTSLDSDPIRKGDQFIHVDLGLSVPLFYLTPDGITADTNLDLGGAGRIGYSRFITSRMSLGGFFGFSFNQTLGENTYLALPMAIRASYEFVFNRITFPCHFRRVCTKPIVHEITSVLCSNRRLADITATRRTGLSARI